MNSSPNNVIKESFQFLNKIFFNVLETFSGEDTI